MKLDPRNRRRRGLLCAMVLLLTAWPPLSWSQAILENDLVDPRTFGYVVGDKIRREMLLTLNSGYVLDEESLPGAGRLDRWLEVAAPEIRSEAEGNATRYRIVLTYQIFNAPLALETVTVPQQDIRILTDDGAEQSAFTTLIPALRITVAPVTSAVDAGRLSEASLQADLAPVAIPVDGRQRRIAWAGLALLVLLLYAAWRGGMAAFLSRGGLPFTRALRELRKLQPASGAPVPYASGLKIVHDAINSTAGRATFAHNVNEFLAAHPAYAGLRDDFHEMFAASGRMFFAGEAAGQVPAGAWQSLLQLCQRCSSIERRQERTLAASKTSEKRHEPGV
jgi:mxaA protein